MKPNNDFEKCTGDNCSYKENCYRHIRPTGTHQSWQPFHKHADDDCKFYEPVPMECKQSGYDQVEQDEFKRAAEL